MSKDVKPLYVGLTRGAEAPVVKQPTPAGPQRLDMAIDNLRRLDDQMLSLEIKQGLLYKELSDTRAERARVAKLIRDLLKI